MMMQVWKLTTQHSSSNGQMYPDTIKFTTYILLLR
jgi:hypothetical protein